MRKNEGKFRKEAVRKYSPWKAGSRTEGVYSFGKGVTKGSFSSEMGLKALAKAKVRGSKDNQHKHFPKKLA